jgi:hypothetical protein
VALVANSGLTAIFGVGFWLAAARLFAPAAVGRGSALVSALWTVSALAQLNYARSLSGLIPAATRPRKLLASVYGLTVAVSVAIGLASAFALPGFSAEFSYLRGDLLFIGSFTGAVVLWTIFNLEDAALTSTRRATIIPFENGAYGALKLACLFLLWRLGYRSALSLFISWVIPLVLVIVPVNAFLFLRAVPASAAPVAEQALRIPRWVRYDFAGYLLWMGGTLPLPVVVLMIVGPVKAASFYVPFTIASSIDLLSLNLGNTLTAELSRTNGVLTPATKSHLRRVWTGVAVLSGLLFLTAPEVLEVFGDRYRAGGVVILRTFMLAALPRSVLFLGIAVLRSRHRGSSILLLQALSALGTLILGLPLTRALGAVGTAFGWLAASCLAAAVTVVLLRSGRGPARRTGHCLAADRAGADVARRASGTSREEV